MKSRSYSNGLHQALKFSDGELIFKQRGEDGMWNLNVYRNLTQLNKCEKRLKRKPSVSLRIEEILDFENKN